VADHVADRPVRQQRRRGEGVRSGAADGVNRDDQSGGRVVDGGDGVSRVSLQCRRVRIVGHLPILLNCRRSCRPGSPKAGRASPRTGNGRSHSANTVPPAVHPTEQKRKAGDRRWSVKSTSGPQGSHEAAMDHPPPTDCADCSFDDKESHLGVSLLHGRVNVPSFQSYFGRTTARK